MAKQPEDTVTAELPLAAKRGRPKTGKAMTAAERQKAKRDRETGMKVESLSLSGLIDRMQGGHIYMKAERAEAWMEYGKRMNFMTWEEPEE